MLLAKIAQNTQFLKLWGNQILLQIAFNLSGYTILLILADRTHSPFVQAQFYTALTLPAIFFGLIAGVVADIFSRKMIMVTTDIILALLFFLYAVINESIFLILATAFLTTSVARFFAPAEAATIPLIVKTAELSWANALYLFTAMGSVLVGFALAGPIIQIFGGLGSTGELVPFYISTIMMLAGFLLLVFFKYPFYQRLDLGKKSFLASIGQLILEMVDMLRSQNNIRLCILLIIFVELNIGIMSVLLLEYVHRYLMLPLVSISYILMLPFVLGLAFGASKLQTITQKIGRWSSMYYASIGVGSIYMLLGIVPVFFQGGSAVAFLRVFAMLAAFAIGFLVVLVAVGARTLLQTAVLQTMLGRVFALLDVLIAVFTPIPVLFVGFIADKVNLLLTISLIGIVILAVFLFSRGTFNKQKI